MSADGAPPGRGSRLAPSAPPPYPGSPAPAAGGPVPDAAELLFAGHIIDLTVEQWGPN